MEEMMMTEALKHRPTMPNFGMSMSPSARNRMRATEKAIHRYYNDLGKAKGNCSWGIGVLAHRGVCSEAELARKVTVKMVDVEFDRRVADAERVVQRSVTEPLNQAQFDALCSLTYNAGPRGARDTFSYVNRRDFAGAAANISSMVKVAIVVEGKKTFVLAPGLVKRRAEESAPFRLKSVTISKNR